MMMYVQQSCPIVFLDYVSSTTRATASVAGFIH